MSLSTECATTLQSFQYPSKDLKNIKAKSKNRHKKAHGSLRILNHPLTHNHSSLRHITAHPKIRA